MKIRVMTWNVLYQEKADNILSLVKKIDPDILCCQELTPNSSYNPSINVAEHIAKALKYNYYFEHSLINSIIPGELIFGNAIFSKFPISDQKRYSLKDTNRETRTYIELKTRVGGRTLTIGTTHLSFTTWFKVTAHRRKEVNNLLDLVRDKKKNFILTGDFNSSKASYTTRELEKLFKSAGPPSSQNTFATKPFFVLGFEVRSLEWRLDYIFVTKDLKVKSSQIIKTEFSDHLPIVTEIEI